MSSPAGLVTAESGTSKKKAVARKTVDHLELHPKMGGGHIVKHVYSGYEHDPMEVHFGKDGTREGKGSGHQHVLEHLTKHGGLPPIEKGREPYDEREESETEDEIKD